MQMPCRITDGPQDETIDIYPPHPMQVIRDLPNSLANELITDECVSTLYCRTGKTYLEAAIDYVLEGDYVEAGIILEKAIESAGASMLAMEAWEKEIEGRK